MSKSDIRATRSICRREDWDAHAEFAVCDGDDDVFGGAGGGVVRCCAECGSRQERRFDREAGDGGFLSSERLENLHKLIQGEIDQKQLAGAVTILARHGKIVEYRIYGQRDIASGTAMTKDTIFRDYSMTKPVTGVAMMVLYEEGKWLPTDPIAKYIPEFAHLKVFNGVDADGKMILVDPEHAPTMRELMSHSAGFSYGNGDSPVDVITDFGGSQSSWWFHNLS